ncbi:MAG: trypsin-like peptidase domain-containing protein [Clostridiales bacterium]
MKKSISIVFLIFLMLFTAVLGGFFALTWANALPVKEKTVAEPLKSPQSENSVNEVSVVDIGKNLSKSVVGISNLKGITATSPNNSQGETGIGSGVILDSRGYIVTNFHVISGGEQIMVTLSDGNVKEAKIIGTDQRTDLALLKIEGENYEAAVLGNSDDLSVGETAIAIGNPGGLDFAGSVTMGIISGLNRPLITEEGLRFKLIQTDAAINPGNSGGALANDKGEVVAINTIKISETGFEGMGFAIPSNLVSEIVTELMDTGKVTRAALGVYLTASVNPEFNAINNVGVDHGVLISPQEGGPGALGGLEENDVITAVDGNKIHDIYELQDVIFSHEVGDVIKITVMRNGNSRSLSVTLGELKDS